MQHDVRAIANFVLDIADQRDRPISNLGINKILFFLHAYFLVRFDRPLVTAKIEAWDYGPVFREVYREFKNWGEKPIKSRAYRMSPETGQRELCTCVLAPEEQQFLESWTRKYVSFSAGALVSMSHELGGPWDQVWNHKSQTNASMQISNDLIKDWYAKAARH